MNRENCQKIKLLALMEMLRQETDEKHPLTTSKICERLNDRKISCDRRTLGKDIALLCEFGFEVMSNFVGHEKAYYIEDRNFNIPELKILIDAVQAASFITEKKTAQLIDKIAHLGGSHCAEILKRNIICFNTRKHSNESIFYNVGFLEQAIWERKKVSFLYFDLDENAKKVYRKNQERYIVDPVALVYSEDNYYLMSYSAKYDNICNYRVDRMNAVEIADEPVSDKAIIKESDVSQYTKQVFKMYGGQMEEMVLRFDNSLIGAVYDKFGEGTKMTRVDENTCKAAVKVQISPTFEGWVYQFGNKLRVEKR